MIDYALTLARQGVPVFPLAVGGKTPLTQHGFHDATTDEKQITAWWQQWPEANIGIPTGKASNRLVVDVDKHGEDGTKALAQLKLPRTHAVKTPREGYHLTYEYPADAEVGRLIGVLPGIDLLGDNGYVVAPGSVVNGVVYQIVCDCEPVPCPAQLLELAQHRKRNGGDGAGMIGGMVSEGGRNNHLASMAGMLRRQGLSEDAIFGALLAENNEKCSPALPQLEIAQIARSIARYEPEPDCDTGDDEAELSRMSRVSQPDPTPLVRELPPPEKYPLQALGPILGPAAQALVDLVQVPAALAGNSVLAAAALAVQAHVDVDTLGGSRPTSLYVLTVAASGDRKSACDELALLPVREHAKNMLLTYRTQLQEWERAQAAVKLNKSRARETAKDGEEYKAALEDILDEPAPRRPWFVCSEPTCEGLVLSLSEGQVAQGIFTDEGGQLIGSHALSDESELRTIALLSRLWQGAPIDRVRATNREHVTLFGRRLSMHPLCQPEVAAKMLGKALYRSQGFLARWLIAAPESLAGSRIHDGPARDARNSNELRRYWSAIRQLLETPLVENRDTGGVDPRCLHLEPEAHRLLVTAYNEFEIAQAQGRELEAVREWAAKAAEHACRIAGVLTVMADPGASLISRETMHGALELVTFYINEYQRLIGVASISDAMRNAQRLLEWLQRNAVTTIKLRDVMRRGPNSIRGADAARSAIKILASYGWLRTENGGRTYTLVAAEDAA